ncbi:MAG: AAA family ATPase, partial [Anaerolineae bacterium]|nr:AAA family ATPase [Anaerolineae bacterium]
MPKTQNLRLLPAQLYRQVDLKQFDFEITTDLETLSEVVGQPRAVEAIQFGIGMMQPGYNIFALGPTGLDKRGLVMQFFTDKAKQQDAPADWCYVHNFDQPHSPLAIQLPAGIGRTFAVDMKDLAEELQNTLTAAFDSEEYQTRRQSIHEDIGERQADAFSELQRRAQKKGLALVRTSSGIVVAPTREGEVLSSEDIQKLSEEEQARIQEEVETLQEEMQKILGQFPGWQREMRDKVKELNREMADFAVGGLLDALRKKYTDYPKILTHLNAVQ